MESDIKSPIHRTGVEHIREWLVLGPFFPDDLSRDFLVNSGGEVSIEPKAGDTVTTLDGTVLTWERHRLFHGPLVVHLGDHQQATV